MEENLLASVTPNSERKDNAPQTNIIKHIYNIRKKQLELLSCRNKKKTESMLEKTVLPDYFFKKRYKRSMKSEDYTTKNNQFKKSLVTSDAKKPAQNPVFLNIFEFIIDSCISSEDEFKGIGKVGVSNMFDKDILNADLSFKVRDQFSSNRVDFKNLVANLRTVISSKLKIKEEKENNITDFNNSKQFYVTEFKDNNTRDGFDSEAISTEKSNLNTLKLSIVETINMLKGQDYKKAKLLEILLDALFNYINKAFCTKLKRVKQKFTTKQFEWSKEKIELEKELHNYKEEYKKSNNEKFKIIAENKIIRKNREKYQDIIKELNNYAVLSNHRNKRIEEIYEIFEIMQKNIDFIKQDPKVYAELNEITHFRNIEACKVEISQRFKKIERLSIMSRIKEPEELIDFSLLNDRHTLQKVESIGIQTEIIKNTDNSTQVDIIYNESETQTEYATNQKGVMCKMLDNKVKCLNLHISQLNKKLANKKEKPAQKDSDMLHVSVNNVPTNKIEKKKESYSAMSNHIESKKEKFDTPLDNGKSSIMHNETSQNNDIKSVSILKSTTAKIKGSKTSYNYQINYAIINANKVYKKYSLTKNRINIIASYIFRALLYNNDNKDPLSIAYKYFSTKSVQQKFVRKYFLVFINTIENQKTQNIPIIQILSYILNTQNINLNLYMLELLRKIFELCSPL